MEFVPNSSMVFYIIIYFSIGAVLLPIVVQWGWKTLLKNEIMLYSGTYYTNLYLGLFLIYFIQGNTWFILSAIHRSAGLSS